MLVAASLRWDLRPLILSSFGSIFSPLEPGNGFEVVVSVILFVLSLITLFEWAIARSSVSLDPCPLSGLPPFIPWRDPTDSGEEWKAARRTTLVSEEDPSLWIRFLDASSKSSGGGSRSNNELRNKLLRQYVNLLQVICEWIHHNDVKHLISNLIIDSYTTESEYILVIKLDLYVYS